MKAVKAVWLGRRRYEPVHTLQQRLVEARSHGRIGDVVLLLEHQPVITLGRSAQPRHVLGSAELLAARGIDRVETGRGGDVTFHGPGQLVCYPILDLSPDRCDVRKYVRGLCEVMILVAREYGVEAGVVEGLVGVWADRAAPYQWAGGEWARDLAKLGAVGVRISRWITMHGFALNLTTNLADFQLIIPCGIQEHGVTSIHALTGASPEVRTTALQVCGALGQALDLVVDALDDLTAADDLDHALLGATG